MAGSIVATTATYLSQGIVKTTITWVSDASGNVSGNAFAQYRGFLRQVKFIPNSGGTQPTTLYDVTLLDADSFDVLIGAGANLSKR